MLEDTLTNRIKQAFETESKMAFFVGAGISRPSRLPLFKELSKKALRLITENRLPDTEYEFLSENIRPEVIFQMAVSELGTKVLCDIIVKGFCGHRPNPNHFFLAEAIRMGNWVFTTNYDDLIEQACGEKGVTYERCTHESHFEKFVKKYIKTGGKLPSALFKLHGSMEDLNTIQASLRQVGRGLSEFKRELLAYFLQNFDFCFLGCSCLDDFSVYPILLNTESEKYIYWLFHTEGAIGEGVWGKERLQHQRKEEENRPPDKRDRRIINVNSFLLKRKNFLKLVGDSSEFLKDNFRQEIERR